MSLENGVYFKESEGRYDMGYMVFDLYKQSSLERAQQKLSQKLNSNTLVDAINHEGENGNLDVKNKLRFIWDETNENRQRNISIAVGRNII